MKRIKEMMIGKRRITLKTVNGYVNVVKELAHRFDEELNEHFFYIYKLEIITDNSYTESYL